MKPTRQMGNTVLPSLPARPNMPQFPTLNLESYTLPAHNATLQPFMKGTGPKPSASFMPNVPVVKVPESKIGAENFMPALSMNHSVHETFGGSPRWEAEQMAHRPTNPRIMGQAPSVRIDFAPRQIPIMERTITPRANLPNMPNLNGVVKNAEPTFLEARPVLPPVTSKDLGGLTSSTSKFCGIGNSPGRAFGAESFLIHKF